MLYEYISVSQHGMSVTEVINKLNELGEEGYRLVPQNSLSVLIFERSLTEYEFIETELQTGQSDRERYEAVSLALMTALTILVLIGLVIGSIHWLR